jgi:hypothetical protein
MRLEKYLCANTTLIALNIAVSCVLLAAIMPVRTEEYRVLGCWCLGGIAGLALAFAAELWLRSPLGER